MAISGSRADGDDEPARVRAVRGLGLLDTAPEERFDRVVRLARQLFDVPMVAVNLIDADRQFAKSAVGLALGDSDRETSFCTHTIETDDQLVVPDARVDPRFADNPSVVGDPGIRFYAGQPLSAHGQHVGALCLVDDKPRVLSPTESRLLRDLGAWVENELNLDQELLQAREVQRRLLPHRPPALAGLDVAGRCVPARDVGGDFFDWQVGNGQLQVLIADVMGKGITAAIVAAGIRAVMRGASRYNDLATSVARTAASMQEDLDETSTFVTLFAARLDPATGHLEYVDAGHGLALVLGQDGASRTLGTTGLPVGVVAGDSWECVSDRLAEGETLLLVSDGILDAFTDVEKAIRAAEQIAAEGLDANGLVDRAASVFTGQSQPDDVTVVAVTRVPAS